MVMMMVLVMVMVYAFSLIIGEGEGGGGRGKGKWGKLFIYCLFVCAFLFKSSFFVESSIHSALTSRAEANAF